LEAAAELPVERVEWFVDGEEVGTAGPPYTLLWEAGRGRHRVMAVDGNGFGRSIEVTIE
jgi:membrane carboxypeptidase/penicillin-binding protein PbpC